MPNKPARVGHPPFEPTAEQRNFVAAMAGVRMTQDEIAMVIINPTTGRPINRETLAKYFAKELAEGKSKLKAVIGRRFLERLNAGEWHAIAFGFRHIFGWRENDLMVGVDGSSEGTAAIQVTFVKPNRSEDD